MHCYIILFFYLFERIVWLKSGLFYSFLGGFFISTGEICVKENVCFSLQKGRVDEPMAHLSTGIPLVPSDQMLFLAFLPTLEI